MSVETSSPPLHTNPNGASHDAPSAAAVPYHPEPFHGALRGAIAAMAMTGMRAFTVNAGLVNEPPPRAIIRQRAKGLLRKVPRRNRREAIELAHWGYGAFGGAIYGMLPDQVRRIPGSGPVYGLMLWVGFEAGIAPVLGLSQAKHPRPVERAMLALDHLLYGLVLSETRSRPRTS
jgi:hypothetical protein